MTLTTRTADPTLRLPGGWRRRAPSSLPDGVVLAATGPRGATVLLRRGESPLPAGVDLEDRDVVDLDSGTVAYVRFSVRGDADDLLHERWTWPAESIELTCSVPRADHPEIDEVLWSLAETVDPHG